MVGRGEAGLHHILAASSLADERTRVLKQGDTFAVFDHYGDIKPGGLGEEGLYYEGTRYLSCLLLELEGSRPFFLSSTVRDENDQLAVTLTNPDLLRDGSLWAPLGTLSIALKKFLWQGTCYQQLRVKNHGLGLSTYALALDGDKQPCRVRTSNAGQCLFAGIANPDRAWRVARTLLHPESFSGWGVRTVAATEARYNPMAYHNGSIWPHDNALIA